MFGVGVDKGDEDQEVEVRGTGCFFLFFCFFFFATPCNLHNLSSLTKNRTCTPCSGRVES